MPPPSLDHVTRRLHSGEAVVAGVLSGTSADAIDVVLCRFAPTPGPGADVCRPEQLAFAERPFDPVLAGALRASLDRGIPDLAQTAALSRDLGRAFGRAAAELAREHGLELDLVGSHGQTVYHHDGTDAAATLQLGDGDFVADAAEAPVASDFRQADIAAGGEGAPLCALADDLLFRDLPRPAVVLNLGGIANVTYLGHDDADTAAFDTGPAGSLLDGLARRMLDEPRDTDGAAARQGATAPALVAEALRHPFFDKQPPKSTGRDTFGEDWVDGFVERATVHGVTRPADVLAAAVDFVARHVELGLDALPAYDRLVVCGGGARNPTLMAALGAVQSCPLEPAHSFGVDPDAREALVFAVLAARCVLGIPSTRPAVTGAVAGRVLGKLSPGRAS